MKNENTEVKAKSLIVERGTLIYITADGQRVPMLEKETDELLNILEEAENRQSRLPEVVQDLISTGHLIGESNIDDWRDRSMI